jgi:outer membrane protein assembly factor BamB
VGLRWLDGLPANFNGWAANRAWVVAGGRCFTFGSTEIENLAPSPAGKHKAVAYLTARDAFNGLPLWKVNCQSNVEGAALNFHNTAPLVADGRRVYTAIGSRLVALDAATGKEVLSYPVQHTPVRLALSQGTLVCSTWDAWDFKGLWGEWNTTSKDGALMAFDAQSGKPKWSLDKPAHQVLIADGAVYTVMQTPVPKRVREIVALDLATGKELWRVPHTAFVNKPEVEVAWNGYKPNVDLLSAGNGIVSVAHYYTNTVAILSRDGGKVLWEIKDVHKGWPENAYYTFLVDGQLWHKNKRYDPKSGELKGPLPWAVNAGGCTPGLVIGNIYCESRGCNYFQIALSDDSRQGGKSTHVRYGGARGGCLLGSVAANGMFYTAQNNCACAPGQLPGFVGFGPAEAPSAAEFEAPRPLEKGPAFGKESRAAGDVADWPTFLHDAERSAATSGKLGANLKPAWELSLAAPPDGPLAGAWNARLLPCLTPPVVAQGKAFVAAIHRGEIRAVETATGKLAWTANVGGRIDSPPTILGGLCLVGSHDGWLYAFNTADGQLAWKLRLAPQERRMVAFGQVESVWPAIGATLVADGLLYATAGRCTESDGGIAIAAIEPSTGIQRWTKAVSTGGRQNDTLVAQGAKVMLHEIALDAKTGAMEKPPEGTKAALRGERIPGLEGLVDYTQSRVNLRRSGGHRIGQVTADLLTWNDTLLFGYNISLRHYFALPRQAALSGAEKDLWKRKDFAWRLPVADGCQPVAMIRCGDTLVFGGPKYDRKTEAVSGFLWGVSCEDGKKTFELALDAPPVCNGLAMAGGRLYVSLENGRLVCLAPEK